jgi:high-affinity nickel permease
MIFETYIEDYIRTKKITDYTFEDFYKVVSQGDIFQIEENEVLFIHSVTTVNPITFFTADDKFTNVSSLTVTAVCNGFLEVLTLVGTATLRGIKFKFSSYEEAKLIAETDKEGNITNLKIENQNQ